MPEYPIVIHVEGEPVPKHTKNGSESPNARKGIKTDPSVLDFRAGRRGRIKQ